jgi:hypothetical protein
LICNHNELASNSSRLLELYFSQENVTGTVASIDLQTYAGGL